MGRVPTYPTLRFGGACGQGVGESFEFTRVFFYSVADFGATKTPPLSSRNLSNTLLLCISFTYC